jgi:hypothetical protein
MSVISRLKKIVIYTISILVLLLLALWGASFVVLPWLVNKQLEPLGLVLNNEAILSLNPFNLHIQIDDLAIVDKANINQFSLEHAHLNVSWLDLMSKQVIIEKAAVKLLHINVLRNKEQLIVAGIDLLATESQKNGTPEHTMPAQTAKASPVNDEPLAAFTDWRFLMPNLSMSDIAININDFGQSQQVVLTNFSIDALSATLSDMSVNVMLDAVINESSLVVKSVINTKMKASKLLSASLDNQLILSKFAVQDWQYIMPLGLNEISEIGGLIDLSIAQHITLTDNQWQVVQPQLRLVLNEIKVVKPELELVNQLLVFELKELTVNGVDAHLTQASGTATLMIEGVHVTTDGQTLASLKSFELPTATFTVDDTFNAVAKIQRIMFKDIIFSQISPADNAVYHNNELTINDISWQDNHLSIDNIKLAKFNSEVILSAEKKLKNLVAIKHVASTKSEEVVLSDPTNETEGKQNTSTPITISLNKFELTAPSHIIFTDESVTPLFKHEFTINKALITSVNSRVKTQMTPFDIALSFDEYATTTIKGAIAPFNDKMNMTLDLKMSEFSLPPLSAYLRTVLGFDFLSGQLDNSISLVIKDDEIDGKTVIDLRGFELASGNDTTDFSISNGSAIGLNSALNMLKDSQGNVSLDVPLSGNISGPSFGISSVLTLVAQKAIMSQAKSYLINTFVPYANIITVASIAGEYLLRVEMNDLEYEIGQYSVSEEQQQFVTELAALLTDKPKQQVKMCAIASVQESDYVAKGMTDKQRIAVLKALSKQRGDVLKNTLIEQYKIKSARLLLCAPKVDSNKNSLPRIEFSF